MKKNIKIMGALALSLASLFSANMAQAQGSAFAIAPEISTLGAGVDGVVKINPMVNGRIGFNKWSHSMNREISGIQYNADINLKSVHALVDVYPFHGVFRVSAGLYNNKNSLDLISTPTQNVTINGTSYSPAQVGQLVGNVKFRSTAPYLGIGFGNPVGDNKRLSFSADFGVLFQGSPSVSLTSTGSCSANAQCAGDVAAQTQKSQQDLKNFRYYPVATIAVAYKF